MKKATKKLIVFGVVIALFTSVYAAFLNTVMKQGFLTHDFFFNWVSAIPKTYLLMLPFVLITGRMVGILVDKMFPEA